MMIEQILIAALFITGFWYLGEEGELLSFAKRKVIGCSKKSPLLLMIFKPLWLCCVCMSSVWGTGFYYYFNSIVELQTILFCVVLAGTVKLLTYFL